LSRQSPPDLSGAISEISEAIRIRDKRKRTGWKYYEFRRARYLIQQDEYLKKSQASDPESTKLIVVDLKVAFSDPDKWKGWIEDTGNSDVKRWIEVNGPLL
jgi:hypothetical protein